MSAVESGASRPLDDGAISLASADLAPLQRTKPRPEDNRTRTPWHVSSRQRTACTPASSLCCSLYCCPSQDSRCSYLHVHMTRLAGSCVWRWLDPYLLPSLSTPISSPRSLDTHSITTESSSCNIRCNENGTLPALELLQHPVSLALHARHTPTHTQASETHTYKHTRHTQNNARKHTRDTPTYIHKLARQQASAGASLHGRLRHAQ